MASKPGNAGSSAGLAGNPPDPAVPPHRYRVPAVPPHRDRGRGAREDPRSGALAWIPYLIVLAGVAAGMYVAWQGSRSAGHGAGLAGCSLLAAALARLVLPPRYVSLLSSRRKASDVLAFTAFGAGVLVLALVLP